MTSLGSDERGAFVASDLFNASTPDIPNVELGMYDAELISVTRIFIPGGQYGEGYTTTDENGVKVNRFRWVFALFGDDGEALYDEGDPIEVDCVTGMQFFAKAKNMSKQCRIMKALLPADEFAAWAEGEPLTRELVGSKCQVEVDENNKGYPTAANVLAPRKRRAARTTVEADA